MIKLSSSQLRKIYKTAKEIGMDNELLHSYIEALIGKEHIRDLTMSEATIVIRGLAGEDVRSESPRFSVMSSKQKGMILYLASELGWLREDRKVDLKRLDGYVRKEYSTLYFFNLSRSNACKCIESMKAMLTRKEKQRC